MLVNYANQAKYPCKKEFSSSIPYVDLYYQKKKSILNYPILNLVNKIFMTYTYIMSLSLPLGL